MSGPGFVPVPPADAVGEAGEGERRGPCDAHATGRFRRLRPRPVVGSQGGLECAFRYAEVPEPFQEPCRVDRFGGRVGDEPVEPGEPQRPGFGPETVADGVLPPVAYVPEQRGGLVEASPGPVARPAGLHAGGHVGETERVPHPRLPALARERRDKGPDLAPEAFAVPPFVHAVSGGHGAQPFLRLPDPFAAFEALPVFAGAGEVAVAPCPRAPLVVAAGFDPLPVGQDDLVHVVVPDGAHAENRVGLPVARIEHVAVLEVAQRHEAALGEPLLRGHRERRAEGNRFARPCAAHDYGNRFPAASGRGERRIVDRLPVRLRDAHERARQVGVQAAPRIVARHGAAREPAEREDRGRPVQGRRIVLDHVVGTDLHVLERGLLPVRVQPDVPRIGDAVRLFHDHGQCGVRVRLDERGPRLAVRLVFAVRRLQFARHAQVRLAAARRLLVRLVEHLVRVLVQLFAGHLPRFDQALHADRDGPAPARVQEAGRPVGAGGGVVLAFEGEHAERDHGQRVGAGDPRRPFAAVVDLLAHAGRDERGPVVGERVHVVVFDHDGQSLGLAVGGPERHGAAHRRVGRDAAARVLHEGAHVLKVVFERVVGRPPVLVGDAFQEPFHAALPAARVQADAEQGEPVAHGEPLLFGGEAQPVVRVERGAGFEGA